MTMPAVTMIDMHAHWRPAEIADALRARTREPRILRNQEGAEVLRTRESAGHDGAKAEPGENSHQGLLLGLGRANSDSTVSGTVAGDRASGRFTAFACVPKS